MQVLHLYSVRGSAKPITNSTWLTGAGKDNVAWSMPWNAFIAQHRISAADGVKAIKALDLKKVLWEMGVDEAELGTMNDKDNLADKLGWAEPIGLDKRTYGRRALPSLTHSPGTAAHTSPSTSASPSTPASSGGAGGGFGGSPQRGSGASSSPPVQHVIKEHRSWDWNTICGNCLTEGGCPSQSAGCSRNHPLPCIFFPTCRYKKCVFLHKGCCYKYQRWGEQGCNKAQGRCPFGKHVDK